MMLLYIANIRIPTEKGNGIQIMEMASAFAKASADKSAFRQPVEVGLVVPTRRNPNFRDIDPFRYYGVEKNFTIRYLNTVDPWWLIWLPAGVYIKIQSLLFMISLKKFFSCHPELDSGSRKINKQRTGLSSRTLVEDPKIKNKQKKNSIFSFFFSFLGSLPRLGKAGSSKAGMTGVRENFILYTRDEYLLSFLLRHSNNVVWEDHTLPRRRERYVKYWNQCRAIVAITKGLKDGLVSIGVAPGKILVAPDGVDPKKFESQKVEKSESRKMLGLLQDQKIVLYTGQLFEWKGARVLLEAARKLQSSLRPSRETSGEISHDTSPNYDEISRLRKAFARDDNNFLFLFVGGMKADVERFRQKAKGLLNVRVIGHVPYTDLPKYMASADVAVLPNTSNEEISARFTSPLKLFQYMSMGLPIVASDIPSLREVLNESNAVLVESNNPQALMSGIQRILQNPELARTIAEKAKEDVKECSWEKRAEKIIEFIENV